MNVAEAVARYAERFHGAVGDEHHVGSPLGAWLLLALVAPAAGGDRRAALAEVLGCDIAEADEFARALLATPHPVLALAAAAWSRVSDPPAELVAWLGSLVSSVAVGPMPTQREADAWTADKTLGLIEEFPLNVEKLLLALVTAVATKITWVSAFEEFDARELALTPAESFGRPRRLLTERGGTLVDTAVGTVGVHEKWSRERDLVVVSVIADPSLAPADVLRVAHPLAVGVCRGGRALPGQLSMRDLPLGTGHSWTVHEVQRRPGGRGGVISVLPAWSARSQFDLLADPQFGFTEAAGVLANWIPGPPAATQVALARYTRTGFEAAAVTVLAIAMSGQRASAAEVIREIRIEFTHPYAVVAVARGHGRWDGIPVFSAWVTRADDPDPDAF